MPGDDIDDSLSGHLVDPGLRDYLRIFPILDLHSGNLAAVRSLWSEMTSLGAVPEQAPVSRERIEVPTEGGGSSQAALLYRPETHSSRLRPAMFNIHGGGYVMGGPELNDLGNITVCEVHDCVVLAPSYRLAPETQFPGAIEDCYAALAWLFDNAETLGVDPSRIVVSGESAGGGLAAALMLMVRDRRRYSPAGQVLFYAMIDDRTGTSREGSSPYLGEFIWPPRFNRFGWTSLLGSEAGGKAVSPYAAAARADDLTGLPPTFIATGALDLFFEENVEYGKRLAKSGIPLDMHVYPGAFHGFELVSESHLARRLYHDRDAALRWMWGLAEAPIDMGPR